MANRIENSEGLFILDSEGNTIESKEISEEVKIEKAINKTPVSEINNVTTPLKVTQTNSRSAHVSNPLPSTYTQLSYIKFNGDQYIDTGLTGGSYEDYEIKFNLLSYVPQSYNYLGRLISYWYDTYEIQVYQYYRTGDLYFENIPTGSSSSTQTNILTVDSDDHIINYTDGVVKLDNIIKGGTYSQHGWGNTNATIGVRCTDHNRRYQGRIYYAKLYSDGVLVRDFIAAQRKSDNVVGLYDLQNQVFYTNGGSGSFTPGPAVEVNKVVFGSDVLIDLTSDTVTNDTLMSGFTAHNSRGNLITGTFVQSKPIEVSTASAMNSLLVSDNIGKSYIFIGPTDATYTNGNLYTVEDSV